jgi:hypothetical protein
MPYDSRYDFNMQQGPQMDDVWAQFQRMLSQGPPEDYLGGYFQSNFPSEIVNQLREHLGGSMNRGTDLESYGFDQYMGMLPGYFGNLNQLQNYGLPGMGQVQNEQGWLGNYGQGLLGPYGSNLNQIMQQGLPNQRGIEGLFGPQAGLGQYYDAMNQDVLSQLYGGNQLLTPQQLQLQGQNADFIKGGGLTPEYIKAARSQILEPSQLSLKGDLNKMGGGFASMTSPEFQQILADQETDFNDRLTMQGFQNLQDFMSRGERLGATGFNQPMNLSSALYAPGQAAYGNAFRSFGDVAGAAAPYYQMAGNTGLSAMDQSLNRFSQGSGYGLSSLNTLSDLMSRPYQMGQQSQWGNTDRLGNLLNSLTGAGLDYRGQNLGYQRGQQSDLNSLLQSLIGERSQARTGQQQLDAARAGKSGGLWGNAVSGGLGALGDYLRKGNSGGGGSKWGTVAKIGASVAPFIFSTSKLKHGITPYLDHKQALDLVARQPLYRYTYTKDVDQTQKQRIGIVLETSDRQFSEKDAQHMDVVTTIGLLMASVKALREEIAELRRLPTAARRGPVGKQSTEGATQPLNLGETKNESVN